MELSRTTIAQYNNLKLLGFPINSTSKHPTPTLAFTSKWLREAKKLHIEISLGHDEDTHWFNAYVYLIKHDYEYDPINIDDDLTGNTHDEAESKAIDYCVKLLLNIGGGSVFFNLFNTIYSIERENNENKFYSVEEMNCPECDSVTAHELRENVSNKDGGELWTCILCKTQLH